MVLLLTRRRPLGTELEKKHRDEIHGHSTTFWGAIWGATGGGCQNPVTVYVSAEVLTDYYFLWFCCKYLINVCLCRAPGHCCIG